MKFIPITMLCVCLIANTYGQNTGQQFVTQDIDNFWEAFDKITATKDSTKQVEYIKTLFIEKGSPGLKALMEARDYTANSYIQAIQQYPLFWNSIRKNTLKAIIYAKKIEQAVDQLKIVYPSLKPAKVYFTVGALRSNGTTLNNMVLIGSELALAGKQTIATELPKSFNYLKPYFESDPVKGIVPLNIHEYIHTQQNTTIGYDLLSQCLIEGVAEFVPVIALGKQSTTPAITFGKKNNQRVKEAFSKELFSRWYDNWLWNDFDNEFKVRDLGYYVGYAIAEKYYTQTKDKKLAIKTMIELDYGNKEVVEEFINKTGYFDKLMNELRNDYEKNRPRVIKIDQFENNSQLVSPTLVQLTIRFSTRMDKRYQSKDVGELGIKHLPEIKSSHFSEDGKSISYEIKLEPGKQYQLLLEDGFRTEKNSQLIPYLINFKTADH